MADVNRSVWRGSTQRLIWRLKARDGANLIPLDLAGHVVRMRAQHGRTTIDRSSADGGLQLVSWAEIVPDSGADPAVLDTIIWHPTAAETRLVPDGLVMAYAVELVSGTEQRPLFEGHFRGLGGPNAD